MALVALVGCKDIEEVDDLLGPMCKLPHVQEQVLYEPIVADVPLKDAASPSLSVSLGDEWIYVNGRREVALGEVSNPGARELLLDQLDQALTRAQLQTVTLQVSSEVFMRDVAQVVEAIRSAGVSRVQFIVQPKRLPPMSQPPDPHVAMELTAGDPATRAMKAATMIEDSIHLCPSLTEAFGAVANVTPEQKCDALLLGIRESYNSFPCFVDHDTLVSAVYALMVPQPVLTSRQYDLLKRSTPIDIASNATWGEAGANILTKDSTGLKIRLR